MRTQPLRASLAVALAGSGLAACSDVANEGAEPRAIEPKIVLENASDGDAGPGQLAAVSDPDDRVDDGGGILRIEEEDDNDGLGTAEVSGEVVAWHPITLTFRGPQASELDDDPNPFLDYRMTVEFRGPSGQSYTVPGFFDGDGAGGGTGDAWSARVVADEGGIWEYAVEFVQGEGVAVQTDAGVGTSVAFDQDAGTIRVGIADPTADGFYKWGKLEYQGTHYPKFREGPWFVRCGVNGPENFLAYAGFDGTFDQGGADTTGLVDGLHRFEPHVADWGPEGLGDEEDPLFVSADTGVDSKGHHRCAELPGLPERQLALLHADEPGR